MRWCNFLATWRLFWLQAPRRVCHVPTTRLCVLFVCQICLYSKHYQLIVSLHFQTIFLVDTMFGSTVVLIIVALFVCHGAMFLRTVSSYSVLSNNYCIDEWGLQDQRILIVWEASFIMHLNGFSNDHRKLMIINHFLFFSFFLVLVVEYVHV